MTSIEGKRGEPRPRPPFPALKGPLPKTHHPQQCGDLGPILPRSSLNGAEWFHSIGTEKSAGTKVFALGGKINHYRPGGGTHGYHTA